MMQDIFLVNQIRAMEGRISEFAAAYTEELRTLNQSYIQASVQAVCQEDTEELEDLLKHYRKLRKVIVSLPKTESEKFFLEAGAFAGAYRVFLDLQDTAMAEALNQEGKILLGRKHVKEHLMYLYQTPYARQKDIAAEIHVQPNYLSEILNRLLEAEYVVRYGKNKTTQYCLTRQGRQICRKHYLPERNYRIDSGFEK